MLFARAYFPIHSADDRDPQYMPAAEEIKWQVEEDIRRGYSFWNGERNPALPQDPGAHGLEELAALLPEKAEDLESWKIPPLSRGGILPGLCALCAAESFHELARKIWKEFNEERAGGKLGKKWDRWGYLAIFEGETVGQDREGWPLFRAKKLIAIAHIDAIASSL